MSYGMHPSVAKLAWTLDIGHRWLQSRQTHCSTLWSKRIHFKDGYCSVPKFYDRIYYC